jgi:hypothetical protein
LRLSRYYWSRFGKPVARKNGCKINVGDVFYEIIAPYDLSLNSLSDTEQMAWAGRVFSQLQSKLPLSEISTVAFHSGLPYRKYLVELLESKGIQCIVPLQGLGLGQQMAWYAREG